MMQPLNRRNLVWSAAGFGSVAFFSKVALASENDPERQWPAVQPLLDGYVAKGILPGMAASVAHGTGPAWFLTAGMVARDSNIPVTADSLFRIMSMTKLITGVAVMLLIEDGKMKLDQNLADFIAGFASPRVLVDDKTLESVPATRPITIRHLLTHTSGIGYFSRIKGPLRDEYIQLGLLPVRTSRAALPGIPSFKYAPSLSAFADRLATLPLLADPGTRWIYSMSPDLLGRVIEVAAGMPFDAFLKKRILVPLGMTSTFFTVPKSESRRLMSLYGGDNASALVDPAATSVCLDPPPFLFGGAGLITSPRDYDRFLQMLAGEGAVGHTRIMRPETARLGMSNLLPPGIFADPTVSHGEGFGALGSVTLTAMSDGKGVGTFGWQGGAGTVAFVDRSNGLRVAGYGQYIPETVLPFQAEFADAVYKRN